MTVSEVIQELEKYKKDEKVLNSMDGILSDPEIHFSDGKVVIRGYSFDFDTETLDYTENEKFSSEDEILDDTDDSLDLDDYGDY